MEQVFNNTFNAYITKKDKFESLYIYVIYDYSKEEIEEKFIKIYKLLDTLSDSKKRGFLKTRIYNFQKYLTEKKETMITGIFLVDDDVNEFKLEKFYLETLKMFNVSHFNYQYGKNFDIEWLKNLVLDRDYVNIMKVKNNDVTITKVTSSKQLQIYSETVKAMNLIDIINSHIEKDRKFFIHGSSNAIKVFDKTKLTPSINKMCIEVLNKELTIEQQIAFVEESKYKQNTIELDNWLTKLLDPKEGHKIVFGKDILENAENSLIETIYCIDSKNVYTHIDSVNVKLVKSFKNGDSIFNFEKNYGGVLGIKYY
jgi:hypothetical protein